MVANPHSNVPTSSGKPFQKSGGCYGSKGWTNYILMPMILKLDFFRQAGVHIHYMTKSIYANVAIL
jgi:hypothetical protein